MNSACPACFSKRMGRSECPDCGAKYPVSGWDKADVVTIAMAGAVNSGKSHYIASMVAELAIYVSQAFGNAITPLGNTADNLAENYLIRITGVDPRTGKPVLDPATGFPAQPGKLDTTASLATENAYQKEPLMWSLGRIGGVTRVLVIRDVAGEDIEQGRLVLPEFAFFPRSDAVFFMFDPHSIPGIDTLLPPEALDKAGARSDAVWANLAAALPAGGPMMGVIVSKFDLLQSLKNQHDPKWSYVMSNASARFYQDQPPSARPRLENGQLMRGDPDDALKLSLELISLLDLAGGQEDKFLRASASANPRFFAVSSLGEPVKGQRLSPRGICRFRVLDPITWVFNRRWF
ncbi:MAG: hypothetical protein LBS27_12255 [Bifidobacteriaceae bacterium]|jgi:hypothetical protein|nr:hypothetical protein [Bifidobacteriaceae bacterium]